MKHFLLATLGAGILVGQIVLFLRMQRLERQLGEVERTRAKPAAAVPRESPPPASEPETRRDAPAAAMPSSAPSSTPSSAPGRADAPVSAADVEAIARKVIEEHESKRPKNVIEWEMEDPIEILERELKLSPSQKERIQKHMSDRDQALDALMKQPDLKDMGTHWNAVEQGYDTAIRNELDNMQQAKYDELKKSGRIGFGDAIRVMVGPPAKAEK